MQHGRIFNTKSSSKLRTLHEEDSSSPPEDFAALFSKNIRPQANDEFLRQPLLESTTLSSKHFMNQNASTTITIGKRTDPKHDTSHKFTPTSPHSTLNKPVRRSSLSKVSPSNNTIDLGEPIQLQVWFHELRSSSEDVIITSNATPSGVKVDQTYELTTPDSNKKLYFVVSSTNLHDDVVQEESANKTSASKFQISLLSNPLKNLLDLAPRSSVKIKRVFDLASIEADSIEVFIKDVNFSRDSMWNFSSTLVGSTVYVEKRLSFNDLRTGIVNCIYKNGKKVFSGYISSSTKVVYRSESAKLTVLVQLSQEMWHFEENGEIMFHKLVNSLFPKIFKRWRDNDAHHSITIVLFTSVDLTQIPWNTLGAGERPNNRQDYFRTVVDQVNIVHWDKIMANLRLEFANFKRDIMLNLIEGSDFVIKGELLPTVKGNILEAINLGLTSAVNRFRNTDLKHTLNHFMVITPGTGLFDVEYDLFLKTSTKISQMDCGLDIICLSQPPLHIVPLFRYKVNGKLKHCVPNWCDISYYKDPNIIVNQWIPRCKIYELQMMGLMETDLNQVTIERFQVRKNIPNLIDAMDDYDNEVFQPICFPDQNADVEFGPNKQPKETKEITTSLSLIFNSRTQLAPAVPKFAITASTSSATGTVAHSNDISALSTLYTLNKNTDERTKSVRKAASNSTMRSVQKSSLPNAARNPTEKHNFLPRNDSISLTKTNESTRRPPAKKKRSTYNELDNIARHNKSDGKMIDEKPLNNLWIEVDNPSAEIHKNLLSYLKLSRWNNVFHKNTKRRLIKWKSFQAPAALPTSTSVFPSSRQLEANYTFQIYNVILNSENYLEIDTTHDLMRELIQLRLLLGFQICYGDLVELFESEKATSGNVDELIKYFPLNSLGSRIYMCLDDEIHKIFCDYNGNIIVQLYRKIPEKDEANKVLLGKNKSEPYRPLIRTRYADNYSPAKVDFIDMNPHKYNWNQFDQFIAGYDDAMPNDIKQFHRMKFVVMPSEIPQNAYFVTNEKLSDEEIRVEGLRKLISVIEKGVYSKNKSLRNKKKEEVLPEISFYTGNLYDYLNSESENYHITGNRSSLIIPETMRFNKSIKLEELAAELQGPSGIHIVDRVWHFRRHLHCFVGSDLVAWLLECFEDIENREEATIFGQSLVSRGLFVHVELRHGFLDGHYFYKFTDDYIDKTYSEQKPGWFSRKKTVDSNSGTPTYSKNNSDTESMKSPNMTDSGLDLRKITSNIVLNESSEISSQADSTGRGRSKKFILSRGVKYDVDPQRKSIRPELVTVHYDKVHNPEHCYHIRLQWLNTTTKFIDETIISWSRLCGRYGLKLIETPWKELCTLPELSPFHSFVEVQLVVNPWTDKDVCLDKVINENPFYYHFYLLKKSGFFLDNRSSALLLKDNLEIAYSWGKPTFKYTQFIHKTGTYIVELRDNGEFFLAPNNIHLIRVSASLSGNIDHDNLKSDTLDSQRVMLDFRSVCQNKEYLRELFTEANANWDVGIVNTD